jgi:hypothetical protein
MKNINRKIKVVISTIILATVSLAITLPLVYCLPQRKSEAQKSFDSFFKNIEVVNSANEQENFIVSLDTVNKINLLLENREKGNILDDKNTRDFLNYLQSELVYLKYDVKNQFVVSSINGNLSMLINEYAISDLNSNNSGKQIIVKFSIKLESDGKAIDKSIDWKIIGYEKIAESLVSTLINKNIESKSEDFLKNYVLSMFSPSISYTSIDQEIDLALVNSSKVIDNILTLNQNTKLGSLKDILIVQEVSFMDNLSSIKGKISLRDIVNIGQNFMFSITLKSKYQANISFNYVISVKITDYQTIISDGLQELISNLDSIGNYTNSDTSILTNVSMPYDTWTELESIIGIGASWRSNGSRSVKEIVFGADVTREFFDFFSENLFVFGNSVDIPEIDSGLIPDDIKTTISEIEITDESLGRYFALKMIYVLSLEDPNGNKIFEKRIDWNVTVYFDIISEISSFTSNVVIDIEQNEFIDMISNFFNPTLTELSSSTPFDLTKIDTKSTIKYLSDLIIKKESETLFNSFISRLINLEQIVLTNGNINIIGQTTIDYLISLGESWVLELNSRVNSPSSSQTGSVIFNIIKLENPNDYDFHVGDGKQFATIKEALDSKEVVNNSKILVFPGIYTISSVVTIDKAVTISGVEKSRVVFETPGLSTDPNNIFAITTSNVTIKNMTIIHKKLGTNSIEAAITASGTGYPAPKIDNITLDSLVIKYMKTGLSLRTSNLTVKNTILDYAFANGTGRGMLLYGLHGNTLIDNNDFRNTTPNSALRAIDNTSTNGTNPDEVLEGKLTISNNSNSFGNFTLLYSQDNFAGDENGFQLEFIKNKVNENGAFASLYISADNAGKIFRSITSLNNEISNKHSTSSAGSKGLVSVDAGSGSIIFRENALAFKYGGNKFNNLDGARPTFTFLIENEIGYNSSIVVPFELNIFS